jgi:tetratricopeptide (TPR) repeat protein
MDTKKLKNIKRTNAWKAAEWDYSEIIAAHQFPLLGERPTAATIATRMDDILGACPQFFPASLFRGQLYILEGKDELAIEPYDQSFEMMRILATKKELIDTIDNFIDFLENELRYDICCKYLRQFVELFPQKALFYDYLAGDIARSKNIDINEALSFQAKAVELEPTNATFLSNQAWINLIDGRLNEAETILNKALEIKPDHATVKGNIEVLQYLKRKGKGTFLDFLLRPVNREKFEQPENNEDGEELYSFCADYNACRMDAFKHTLLKEGEYSDYQVSELSKTLILFFRFVDQVMNSANFLYENIFNIYDYFEPIMHKFIFKHGDIDDEIFDDIYNSLTIFYDFLRKHKLVSSEEYKEFVRKINGVKSTLRKKMHRYNKIRHDDRISEEEKEDIREELFEGDHAWPFL